MKKLLYLIIPCLVASCGAKKETPEKNAILGTTTHWVSSSNDYAPFFDINSYSEHAEYGISEKYPVFVGGFKEKVGPTNQRRYLASLAGPQGEEIQFTRRGSCCPYSSENGYEGVGLLDVYEVWYEGLEEPILIYISFYDKEPLYIPHGFTKK